MSPTIKYKIWFTTRTVSPVLKKTTNNKTAVASMVMVLHEREINAKVNVSVGKWFCFGDYQIRTMWSKPLSRSHWGWRSRVILASLIHLAIRNIHRIRGFSISSKFIYIKAALLSLHIMDNIINCYQPTSCWVKHRCKVCVILRWPPFWYNQYADDHLVII